MDLCRKFFDQGRRSSPKGTILVIHLFWDLFQEITEIVFTNSLNGYYYIRYLLTELMKRKDKDGNIDKGVIVTSSYFTAGAIEEAAMFNGRIDLIDFRKLQDMMHKSYEGEREKC